MDDSRKLTAPAASKAQARAEKRAAQWNRTLGITKGARKKQKLNEPLPQSPDEPQPQPPAEGGADLHEVVAPS